MKAMMFLWSPVDKKKENNNFESMFKAEQNA